MKIALVIPGRFHGFDLARALLAREHDVTVFTNYPHWATRRFGLPDKAVRSCVGHGVLSRVVDRMPGRAAWTAAERTMHQMLGRWAARELAREEWDIIHCWSGISEELLASPAVRRRATLLMRCSSHIETQSRLLLEEEERSGIALDRPTPWVIGRETREYGLADHILVLSTFSRQSFLDHGFSEERVTAVPPGLDLSAFRPGGDLVKARADRILQGKPLNAVFVGAVSLRKGLLDLEAAIGQLAAEPFEFTFVGPVLPECEALAARLAGKARFVGKVPQEDLPRHYAAADLFVFPTIEDGFPYVLAQARASGLPIVTTLHGAGTDIVTDGRDGWIVPVRDPAALADRLRRLAADRAGLAAMADRVASAFEPQGWQTVVQQFEQVCSGLLAGAGHLETS